MTLPIEVQFELAKQKMAIDECVDLEAIKRMLKNIIELNAIQKQYYQELLKTHWNI